jgi:hypothetical protein
MGERLKRATASGLHKVKMKSGKPNNKKRNTKMLSFKRSARALLGLNKRNVTFLYHRDQYHKAYWLRNQLSDGVELVANIERISRKNAAEMLIEAGLGAYMAKQIKLGVESEIKMKELGLPRQPGRFRSMIIKRAKEQGLNVSKYF